MFPRIILLLSVTVLSCLAEPSGGRETKNPAAADAAPRPPADAKSAERFEQIRLRCIEGRRYVAGRVLQVLPEGLVVDSGYSQLLSPPLNRSWVVSGTVSVTRDASAIEESKPDALCRGVVLVSKYPKKPAVKQYDYVVMHAYPAGDFVYTPVPGVQKTVRRFSASLDRAVEFNLDRESK